MQFASPKNFRPLRRAPALRRVEQSAELQSAEFRKPRRALNLTRFRHTSEKAKVASGAFDTLWNWPLRATRTKSRRSDRGAAKQNERVTAAETASGLDARTAARYSGRPFHIAQCLIALFRWRSDRFAPNTIWSLNLLPLRRVHADSARLPRK